MSAAIDDLIRLETFRDLPERALEDISASCVPRKFRAREVLGREGETADKLFVIAAGAVGIWVDHGLDGADLLAVREAPCLVGEMSVVDELPRSATIVARGDVETWIIEADAFRELLLTSGGVALALMKSISRLVRRSNDSFVSELRERNENLEKAYRELKTAQRQLVRQERLSNLGKFSSMIVHDFKNPLSVIQGYADMLDLKLDEEGSAMVEYARNIRRECERLTGLAGELLDYSRGQIRLAYAPVNVGKMMTNVAENIRRRLEGRGIDAVWDIAYDGPALLDEERMTRVLINLIDNARKALPRNGRMTVSTRKEDQHLVIRVVDEGTGMDDETKIHLFEPFYSTSEQGGTGLGMHIVKTIVEAHEGVVEVESSLGEGTSVSLKIPLRI